MKHGFKILILAMLLLAIFGCDAINTKHICVVIVTHEFGPAICKNGLSCNNAGCFAEKCSVLNMEGEWEMRLDGNALLGQTFECDK